MTVISGAKYGVIYVLWVEGGYGFDSDVQIFSVDMEYAIQLYATINVEFSPFGRFDILSFKSIKFNYLDWVSE